jgi:hypothetical protein
MARSSGVIDGSDDPPPAGAEGIDDPFAKIPTWARPITAAIEADVLIMRNIYFSYEFPVSSSQCPVPVASSNRRSQLETGNWIRETGNGKLETGNWILATGTGLTGMSWH